ncbi:zeta toxin family protein [Leucobacter sp. HY1910]
MQNLPEAPGGPVSPREASGLIHAQAVEAADAIRMRCLLSGENFIMEGTLTWSGIVDQTVDELNGAPSPYRQLKIINVEVGVEVAVSRAEKRWVEDCATHPLGGRFVDPDQIRAMYFGGNPVSTGNAASLLESARESGIETELLRGAKNRFSLMLDFAKNLLGAISTEPRARVSTLNQRIGSCGAVRVTTQAGVEVSRSEPCYLRPGHRDRHRFRRP